METYRQYRKKALGGIEKNYKEREAENILDLLYYHFAGVDKITLLKNPSLEMPANIREQLNEAIRRLNEGDPVQHIIGEVEFLDCKIFVNPDVLIPRPETMELANEVIRENKGFKGPVLDVGTGSGCIAIAIKHHLSGSEVTAVDISPKALKLAGKNAEENFLKVNFKEVDFLDPGARDELPVFDIIVSNPPYIPESEKEYLDPLVVKNEPWEALFVPEKDPLVFYKAIENFSHTHLKKGGKIYLELHENYFYQTKTIFQQSSFTSVEVKKDFQGKNRMLKVIK